METSHKQTGETMKNETHKQVAWVKINPITDDVEAGWHWVCSCGARGVNKVACKAHKEWVTHRKEGK